PRLVQRLVRRPGSARSLGPGAVAEERGPAVKTVLDGALSGTAPYRNDGPAASPTGDALRDDRTPQDPAQHAADDPANENRPGPANDFRDRGKADYHAAGNHQDHSQRPAPGRKVGGRIHRQVISLLQDTRSAAERIHATIRAARGPRRPVNWIEHARGWR